MKKFIFFFWLCPLFFLFSGLVLAELSDQEKREFMESLAKPLKKKKTFYRWQDRYNKNQKQKKRLLEAGEMTLELYKEFMSYDDPFAGAGFYVAEEMTSSSYYGTTIIEVEVEAGYKFLNLSDPKIIKALKTKGITIGDAFSLNPEIAVKNIGDDDTGWWALKKREGIKFKPFSMSKVRKKIDKLPIKSTDEGAVLFKIAGEQFSQADVSKIVDKLPLDTWFSVAGFFLVAGKYLSRLDISKIMKKMDKLPMESLSEGIYFLTATGKYLSKPNISKIVKTANTFPLDSIQEGASYLEDIETLRKIDIDISEIIQEKMSQYLKTKRYLNKMNLHSSAFFLKEVRRHLPKADRKKFIDLFLSFFTNYSSIIRLELAFKDRLSELEYNEIATQFKLRKQGVANNPSSGGSSDETARERCLKKWLPG